MKPKLLTAAIYARVSTQRQAEHNGVEYQVNALREYAERREWRVHPSLFIDEGYSGNAKNRPGLRFLWSAVRARKVDVVLVWRFDRFARSLSDLVEALGEFEALGVQFVSLTEQIDTATPIGRAMFAIAGAFAQLERDLAQERVHAGVANARAKGVKLGRRAIELDEATIRGALSLHRSVTRAATALSVSKRTLLRRMAAVGIPS